MPGGSAPDGTPIFQAAAERTILRLTSDPSIVFTWVGCQPKSERRRLAPAMGVFLGGEEA